VSSNNECIGDVEDGEETPTNFDRLTIQDIVGMNDMSASTTMTGSPTVSSLLDSVVCLIFNFKSKRQVGQEIFLYISIRFRCP